MTNAVGVSRSLRTLFRSSLIVASIVIIVVVVVVVVIAVVVVVVVSIVVDRRATHSHAMIAPAILREGRNLYKRVTVCKAREIVND